MRHHLLIIFLCSVILSVFGRAETGAPAPPSGAKPAAKAKAKAMPAAAGKKPVAEKKSAAEKKPPTQKKPATAGAGTPEKSTTGPTPTRAKPGWNVIDYRGQAYLDLAEVAKFFEFPTYTREG